MKQIPITLLALVLTAGASRVHAAQEAMAAIPMPAEAAVTETAPNTAPSEAGTTEAAGVVAPPSPYAACSGCGGEPAHDKGSCLHRLIAWATYCPKERIGLHNGCNSCHYKGMVPLYLFQLNPPCTEGTGVHPTFPNPPCVHGCKGCNGCAGGAP